MIDFTDKKELFKYAHEISRKIAHYMLFFLVISRNISYLNVLDSSWRQWAARTIPEIPLLRSLPRLLKKVLIDVCHMFILIVTSYFLSGLLRYLGNHFPFWKGFVKTLDNFQFKILDPDMLAIVMILGSDALKKSLQDYFGELSK